MKRSPRSRWFHALSVVFAAVPFAFALVRAVRTGSDLRYLWIAIAALGGATATMAVARRHVSGPTAAVALSAGVFVMATLLGVLAALLLGTTLGPGVLAVGSAFGLCFAAACLLQMRQGA